MRDGAVGVGVHGAPFVFSVRFLDGADCGWGVSQYEGVGVGFILRASTFSSHWSTLMPNVGITIVLNFSVDGL